METIIKGRRMVIGLIVVFLLIDIITAVCISSIYQAIGKLDFASYNLLQGIFRFILTGLMMFFLYRGHRWAKWLTVVLSILSGIGSLLFLMKDLNFIYLVLCLVYIVSSLLLIFSSSIDDFFLYQRGENIPSYRQYR